MIEQPTSRISADLSGQPAIVTGAARGLGRAIALTLAAAGAKVACIDINVESLQETIDAIRAAGGIGRAAGLQRHRRRPRRRGGRGSGQDVGRAANPRQQRRHHPRQHDHADEGRAVGRRAGHQSHAARSFSSAPPPGR